MKTNFSWTTGSRTVSVAVDITREVSDIINFSDGWNIKTGVTTVDLFDITLSIDGNVAGHDHERPFLLTPMFHKDAIAKGAVALLGDMYLTKDSYDRITTVIAEMDAMIEAETTDEYRTVKAAEVAKEQAQIASDAAQAKAYKQALANGLCPKCGTYCYGDCEA